MICFHTIATCQWGIGNLKRMQFLAETFRKEGYEIIFFVEIDYSISFSLLKDWMIPFYSRRELIEKINENINNIKCFIIDLPNNDNLSKNFYNSIGNNKLISINDDGLDLLQPNLFFNTDTVKEIPSTFKGEVYRGFEYQILAPDIKPYRRHKLENLKKVNNVALIFGGADPDRYLEYMLYNHSNSMINYHFIIGPGIDLKRKKKLITLCKEKDLKYYIDPCIYEVIQNVDCVVTLGGSTSYESMYIGTAVVAVKFKHMSRYIDYLTCNNMLMKVENISELNNFLENSRACELLNVTKKNAFNKIDGKGAERIKNKILEYIEEI